TGRQPDLLRQCRQRYIGANALRARAAAACARADGVPAAGRRPPRVITAPSLQLTPSPLMNLSTVLAHSAIRVPVGSRRAVFQVRVAASWTSTVRKVPLKPLPPSA